MPLPESGTVRSENPATGATVLEVEATAPAEVEHAVAAAVEAGRRWADTPVAERCAVVRRFADILERDADDLAALIVSEVGKLRRDADGEVAWTAKSARWYADHPPEDDVVAGARVRRRPLGVVAAVTPWNVPLITPAWKWLPALVAGNAVVWKPSELATATALAAHAAFLEAGLPADVFIVVPGGPDTAVALCSHPDVAGVHFTGSTAAGRAVSALASSRFARVALEMGGVNPAIVLADADLDAAADDIVACATALAGQKCTAARRVLVEQSIEAPLVERLAARISALRLGDPTDPDTTLAPLVRPAAARNAEAAVAAAVAGGARIVAQASTPEGEGLRSDAFFPATLLTGGAAWREEVFAPILAVEPVADREAAWQAANDVPYGLSAAVYTRTPAFAEEAAERLEAGVVAINRRGDDVGLEPPFGGLKSSGNGFPEGGAYVYSSLTSLQAVYGAAD
jgi:aldehyde dehydrogenase (NAD+)